MADGAVRGGRLRYVMTLGALVGLMGFATVGRQIVKSMEVSAKQREIETVAAEEFKGLPIAVRQEASGRGFVVSGVAPSQDAAIALNRAIQEAARPVPVTVNLITGLVTSTNEIVGETLNVVTGVADGTVRGVVNTVDKTTRTVVNLAEDVTQTAVKTVDGVVRTTADVVTQTVGAVETLTKHLGSLEQSLAVAAPDGQIVKLPKPIAELPQRLAETEDRIKQGAAERSISDLDGRLQTLKQQLRDNLGAPDDAESAKLQRQVASLQTDIEAARSRLKSRSGADAGASPEDMSALSIKVADVERDAAVAPFKRQVKTLSDSLRVLTARVGGGDAARDDQDERQSRKARSKDDGNAGKDNFDLAGELKRSLTAGPIDAEPYSAEASVRDLAARVKGSAIGPKVNGRAMGASTSTPVAANGATNPVQGVGDNTQSVLTGVTLPTRVWCGFRRNFRSECWADLWLL
ncbi:MAG: hypothetical protein SGJ17_06395 [Hyphomicrobiales bacterium]|nr:hypothetical protein [Hyphomicrobiales bacterium]